MQSDMTAKKACINLVMPSKGEQKISSECKNKHNLDEFILKRNETFWSNCSSKKRRRNIHLNEFQDQVNGRYQC